MTLVAANVQLAWAPIRQLNRIGLILALSFLGVVGLWSITARLSGAVIAPGVLIVESRLQTVQHPTGGVVSELLVGEGSLVEAGQVLVRLDGTSARTSLAIIQSELDMQLLRAARLSAERDGAPTVALPGELAPRQGEAALAGALRGEEQLMAARLNSRQSETSQLLERKTQLADEIVGLEAQQTATQSQLQIVNDDLVRVNALYAQSLVPVQRIAELQREHAQLQGELGRLTSSIANTRGRISELTMETTRKDEVFRSELLDDLQATQAAISGLQERKVAAADALRRLDILAPQAGAIHELAVHTVGGVVGAGQTLMEIVPSGGALVLEARIEPAEIDQVNVGSEVAIRLLAANHRTTPMLAGAVAQISPDVLHDTRSGAAYYLAKIAFADLTQEEADALHLVPGVPAEIYITTESRTPLQYLLSPLTEQMPRMFRERI